MLQSFFYISNFALGLGRRPAGIGVALRGGGTAAALGLAKMFGTAALARILGSFDSGHGGYVASSGLR
jgi:hypothetical protein